MVRPDETGKPAALDALCAHCRGSGVVSYGCGAIPCAACGGTGHVPETVDTQPDGVDKRQRIG